MRTAIEVVWWIGLVGALVPTVVILKLAFLVIARLRRILRLTEITYVAAQGILVHLAPAPRLHGVHQLVSGLDDTVGEAAERLRGRAAGLDRRRAIS